MNGTGPGDAPPSESLLDRIDRLSGAIESCIADGDWTTATTLDVERRGLLTSMFATDAGASQAALDPGARAALTGMLSRLESLITSVQQDRRQLAEQARGLGGASRAVRAYESNF